VSTPGEPTSTASGPNGAALAAEVPAPPQSVGVLGYAEAAAELDRIIAELDRGVIDVDVLEARLCRAVEIVEELDRRIRGARDRVSAILPRLESAGRGEGDGHGAATV
jgi:exonuclease VII small subunit